MKRKQGRVTKDHGLCEKGKKGKNKIFLRKGLCFLTCLLMGDPERLKLMGKRQNDTLEIRI